MIIAKANLLEVFNILANSFHVFYLTGSRRFGCAEENSDWDFFVEETNEVRAFLFSNGFRPHSSSTYVDSNCSEVFRHLYLPIDIQLSADVKVRIAAQEILTIFVQEKKPDYVDWKLALDIIKRAVIAQQSTNH